MFIRKKVRSLDAHLNHFAPGDSFYVVLTGLDGRSDDLRKVGFSAPAIAGEQLLPASEHGIACRRNADGEEIVHRDQPMETHYRQREWTWTEWHGREAVERTGIVEVPYQRYPRSLKPPFGIELQVRTSPGGATLITAGPFSRSTDGKLLLNTVHMFVELFGECRLMKTDLRDAQQPAVRRLNWEVLPPGRYPWTRAKEAVDRVIQTAPPFDQAVLRERAKAITAYEPDFIAVGKNGFSRYVIYGWDQQQLYVLEGTEVSNATYVLKKNWEQVSAMTKAQVLAAGAHHARLIHRNSWWQGMEDLMRSHGIALPGSKRRRA